ncbi:MAG: hypothetical protein WC225_01710 [Acholeplasmataceae bacterium]|nr:hypothetical protein [Acholeplasmataceae bacterium]
MKQNLSKIILTIVVLLFAFILFEFVFKPEPSFPDGEFELIIAGSDENIHYQNTLTYGKEDTLYSLLKTNFALTCANQFYQPDTTCQYQFNVLGQKNHIILAIQGENFILVSDWGTTFLKLEIDEGSGFYVATVGFDRVDLSVVERIRISLDESW